MPRKHKIEETIQSVYELIEKKDDAALDKAYQQLCSEFNDICESKEPYLINLQFQAMAAIIRSELYADQTDDFVQYELQMISAWYSIKENDLLTDAQLRYIGKLIKNIVGECNQYYTKRGLIVPSFGAFDEPAPTKDQVIPRPAMAPHNCFLCAAKVADCKDSHLAPHFLVQPFLSTNGSRQRGKEIVVESMLGSMRQERKWGRSVLPEEIDAVFGKIDEQEKERQRPDALARDDIFCNDCERRFSYIESAYAEYLSGRKKTISPAISYLFWLGVFWRLSIAGMCFKLSVEDEETIRKILNANMPPDKNAVNSLHPDESWGEIGYVLLSTKDTKSELLSLSGNHAVNTPYKLLCGPYIIMFYTDINRAGDKYPINTWHTQEQMEELSFIEWWKERFTILHAAEHQSFQNVSTNTSGQFVDVAKGDQFSPPDWLQGDVITASQIEDSPKYGMFIPGAIMRAMQYHDEHPFQTPEEMAKGIEKEYGYTHQELQEICEFWEQHNSIMHIRSKQNIQRHVNRRKKTQRVSARNNRKRKNKRKKK